jgi:hypothetical protein
MTISKYCDARMLRTPRDRKYVATSGVFMADVQSIMSKSTSADASLKCCYAEKSWPRERSEEILIRCRAPSDISAPMWNVPNQRDLQAYAQWHSWRGRLSHWWHRRCTFSDAPVPQLPIGRMSHVLEKLFEHTELRHPHVWRSMHLPCRGQATRADVHISRLQRMLLLCS